MGYNCDECGKRVIQVFEYIFPEDGYDILVCGKCYGKLTEHIWDLDE